MNERARVDAPGRAKALPRDAFDDCFDAAELSYDDELATLPPARTWRRRLWPLPRFVRAGLYSVGGLILAGFLAIGALHVRLLQGPLDASFLGPPIERAINAEIAPLTVSIGSAVLRTELGFGDFQFRLQEINVVDADGTLVAKAPLAAIGLSARALFTGRIAPATIELIRPALLVSYTEARGLAISTVATEASQAAPETVVVSPTEVTAPAAGGPEQFLLAQGLSRALAGARHGATSASYLTSIGLREARVVLDIEGERSRWLLPSLVIGVDHKQRRSVITGTGEVQTASGPMGLKLTAEESEKRKRTRLKLSLTRFVPRVIAEEIPQFGALAMLGMPVDAEGQVELTNDGELLVAETVVRLGAGALALPSLGVEPIAIDQGALHMRYTRDEHRIEILPSAVQSGLSRATLTGFAVPRKASPTVTLWDYQIRAGDASLGDERRGLGPIAVADWTARGSFVPQSGLLVVEEMRARAGDAEMRLAGRASASLGVEARGSIAAMPADLFKLLWPNVLATNARTWVLDNISGGTVEQATFRVGLSADDLARAETENLLPETAVSAELMARGLIIRYMPALPPIVSETASLRLVGGRLVAEVPTGTVSLEAGGTLSLTRGTFGIENVLAPVPRGVATFKVDGTTAATLAFVDLEPFGYSRSTGLKGEELSGKAAGDYRVELPLINDVKLADVAVKGTVHLTELQSAGAFEPLKLQGGTVDIDLTEKSLAAKGNLILNGISSNLHWVRNFGAGDGEQPPVRVSAILDAADREQIGLPVNHVLLGDVPVELQVSRTAAGQSAYKVQADLSKAELLFDALAWHKATGRTAFLSFDLAPQREGRASLQNFKLYGTEIDIAGGIELGADNKPRAFDFPRFSINAGTALSVRGELGKDNVWSVAAKGSAFDGRPLFRSLFSAGRLSEDQPTAPANAAGLKLTADLEQMTGFFGTSVRKVSITMSRRAGRMSGLEARGVLSTGKPIAARIDQTPGAGRQLIAESADAGSAFRLIGFYANVDGGDASIRVNLDGAGAAEKTGTLWARNFAVLGDSVVSEVIARTPQPGDKPRGQKPQRQSMGFTRMKVPFSVGHGQLIVHEAYINGPVLGATLRGRVDFNREQVQLGGTYVPLYGLNAMFGEVPILGNILGGRRGEGLVGITFEIRGPLKNPNVNVNPISALTPGIFRQIFEFEAPSQRIVPQRPAAGAAPPTTAGAPDASIADAWEATSETGTTEGATVPVKRKPKRPSKRPPPTEGNGGWTSSDDR